MSTAAEPPVLQESHGVDFPLGTAGRILFWIAVVFSLFQIATAAHVIDMPSQIVRAVHVGFLMVLTLPLIAYARPSRKAMTAFAWDWPTPGSRSPRARRGSTTT